MEDGMRVELDLGRHCIATEAKSVYERLLREYFRLPEAGRAEAEARIGALVDFLEHADLAELRSRDPALAGGVPGARATLVVRGPGDFAVEQGGRVFVARTRDF